MSKIGAVFGCTLAVMLIAPACGPGDETPRAGPELEPSPPTMAEEPSDPCTCFCGDNDPLSPRYNCLPEFYACGRSCSGGCTGQGQDVYVCAPPNEGVAWAPSNCVPIALGCEFGTLRYCCGCDGPPTPDA